MWFCSQIGAREHYAIPRALHHRGRLASLYTDFWAGSALRRAQQMADGRWKLGALRSLAARFHPGLADATVQSWNFRSLYWESRLRQSSTSRPQLSGFRFPLFRRGPVVSSPVVNSRYFGYIEVGQRFAVQVRESLKRRSDLEPDSIFFAYDTGALELFAWSKERGFKTVLGQMDPSRVEVQLVREEEKRWPGWQARSVEVPEEYFLRREQEWALADRVVVNSAFSRDALIQQGVPAEKLVVIPLCYEADKETTGRRDNGTAGPGGRSRESMVRGQWSNGPRDASRPLRVLFLGQVILRKGIQYLVEAARLLEGENLRFDVVGPIGISPEAMASAPRNMTFHGRTGRDQAADWYRQADVFVLPTLSDGFALTQLEAMAHGVPVIATPCCGEVVTDGVDGFLIPPRDVAALARALQRYFAEPDLLPRQRASALEKSKQFTLERLGASLMDLETELSK